MSTYTQTCLFRNHFVDNKKIRDGGSGGGIVEVSRKKNNNNQTRRVCIHTAQSTEKYRMVV